MGSDRSVVVLSPMLKDTITVPTGFLTDFASVPRMPFVFLLFGDVAHEAAVIHDYLYKARWLSGARLTGCCWKRLRRRGVMVATLANVGGCAGVRWGVLWLR